MSATAWLAVGVFAVAYALIATVRVHRVKVALGSAVLMILIGATNAQTAFFSPEAGIDWNVLVLLLRMMLIVGVLRRTGVFEYIAIWSANRARRRPFGVMVILVLVTAIASAALENVTTGSTPSPTAETGSRRSDVLPARRRHDAVVGATVSPTNIGDHLVERFGEQRGRDSVNRGHTCWSGRGPMAGFKHCAPAPEGGVLTTAPASPTRSNHRSTASSNPRLL